MESPTPDNIHHNGGHWRPAWGTVQQSEHSHCDISPEVSSKEEIFQMVEVHVNLYLLMQYRNCITVFIWRVLHVCCSYVISYFSIYMYLTAVCDCCF